MWLEILLFLVLLLVYAVIRDRRPRNCPPGPPEIPFLGNFPVLTEEPAQKLKEEYGDVVMHRTGHLCTIIIFDYKVAKEAMARLEFSDRPALFTDFIALDDQKLGGVISSNGPHWQHDRRFVLRNLRNLGMGKSYLEEAINIEAKALVEDLKKYNGEAINFPDSFRTASLNIIWQMVASTRYDLRSKEMEAVYNVSKKFQEKFSPLLFLPSFIPALKRLPKVIKNFIFKYHIIDDLNAETENTVNKAIDKHLEDYDPDNLRDLIDEYVKEMKESEGDENSFFRKGALVQIVNDMFLAGSDTVNHMIKWVTHFMARYPDYAKRMQEQIDEVVPKDRMVSLDDKSSLPLVEAFITEALREASLVPLNVQRSASRNTTLEGYFVPKDTIIAVGTHSIHHDPRYWDDPHKFYPERFLDETRTKYTAPKQGFFAFGSGRRQCAGELLARMELFLFSAAIIQNFDVVAPKGVDMARLEAEDRGGLRSPADATLIYRPRDWGVGVSERKRGNRMA